VFKSSGVLKYSNQPGYGWKLIVEVDPGIASYARALVPCSVDLKLTRYAPHISVVRKEVPVKQELWGLHECEEVPFEYSNFVYDDETYYWLRVFSPRLEEIRQELGLPRYSEAARGPDGHECFHTTIGNTK